MIRGGHRAMLAPIHLVNTAALFLPVLPTLQGSKCSALRRDERRSVPTFLHTTPAPTRDMKEISI